MIYDDRTKAYKEHQSTSLKLLFKLLSIKSSKVYPFSLQRKSHTTSTTLTLFKDVCDTAAILK